ncbi:hypothetical protein CEXT_5261 [Caerostris extrusa]|uniref:Uncharacterized protein n=1 Tax=Caerostris extrusa TaxID=172846 RepID=A0AAV4Y973_CAEEX|nr:hypothetical protein CEXT_5261 [Caerostris extrusa]
MVCSVGRLPSLKQQRAQLLIMYDRYSGPPLGRWKEDEGENRSQKSNACAFLRHFILEFCITNDIGEKHIAVTRQFEEGSTVSLKYNSLFRSLRFRFETYVPMFSRFKSS